MPLLADRILLAVDALLIAAVVATGVLGDRVPLPKGQDILEAPQAIPSPLPRKPAAVAAAQPAPVAPPTQEAAPAPSPPKAEPPPKPGQAEWARAWQAEQRGETHMAEARDAGPSEPDKKRRAYAEAEKAFKEALAELDKYRAICPEAGSQVDAKASGIRSLIIECHKSSPMELK